MFMETCGTTRVQGFANVVFGAPNAYLQLHDMAACGDNWKTWELQLDGEPHASCVTRAAGPYSVGATRMVSGQRCLSALV